MVKEIIMILSKNNAPNKNDDVNNYLAENSQIESTYSGKNIEQFLWFFKRETDFQDRAKHSSYNNYYKSMIDSLTTPVFSEEPERKFSNPVIDAFISDADGRGSSLSELVYDSATEYKKQSQSYAVFNTYKDSPQTLGEQLSTGKIPYMTIKKSYEMISYKADMFGNLTRITFTNGKEGKDDSFITIDEKSFTTHTDRKVIEVNTHNFGFVPVTLFDATDINPYPDSKSISDNNIDIFNQYSEIRDLSRTQGFSLLCIQSDDPKQTVEVSSKNIIWVSSQVTQMPSYISSDAAQLKGLLEAMEASANMMINSVDALGAHAQSVSNSSGLALSFKFTGKNFELKNLSTKTNKYESRLIKMLSNFFPDSALNWDYEVAYLDEFSPLEEAEAEIE